MGDYLTDLEERVRRDWATLQEVMGRIGVRPSRFKRAVMWLAERGGLLKLNGRLVKYSDLSRLYELEGASALLSMQLAAWEALEAVAMNEAALTEVDLTARKQALAADIEALRHHRRIAAETALQREAGSLSLGAR